MTRLIEALKQAEEAKRKEESSKEKSQGLSLELEVTDDKKTEAAPETSLTEPETSESSFDLSLEPSLQETAEPDHSEADYIEPEKFVSEPATTYEIETETGTEPGADLADDEITPSKDIDSEAVGRRLTDQTVSNPDTIVSVTVSRKKRLLIIALIALLLLAGIFAFFYWRMSAQDNPYANLNTNAQSRGFLNDSSNQEPADAIVSENVDTEIPEPAQLAETQTTIGGPVSEPPQTPGQPGADETISAVNALISSPAVNAPAPTVITQPTAVFSIQAVRRTPGSGDALEFARANLQQNEWEAAKSELESLLQAQPTNTRALEYLAQVQIEMGNYPAAETSYARILQLAPHNRTAQAGLIRLSQTNDSLDYEASLLALQTNYPDEAFIPFMLGNHLAGQQRWNEASGAYQLTVELAQSLREIPAQYVYNYAVSLEHLNRSGEALAQYRKARDLVMRDSDQFDIALLNSRIERLETTLGQ